ncbi:N amino acid transport system protein [Escovopsis weberi]|uniref:N amino acid transport system protein n=1 Tax=Escovopsis weberi TaxID=150374 RepID=A0A0M9VXD1_ESCWE|nr:N amino acid transport system protein [Escovopsis weberi]
MSSKAPSLEIRDSSSAAESRAASWASIFGGRTVQIGPRIAPLPDYLKDELSEEAAVSSVSDSTGDAILLRQLAKEDGAAIRYRSCSWQKTAGLLFSEYICLAVMSFPWSYSVLGLVPGVIFTIFVAVVVQYTSLILWEFCLRHPEVRDACDIAEILFWGKRWVWWATAIMFVLNNTFIQGLHVLVGAEYINTMTEGDSFSGTCRTVELSVAITVLSWLVSLPRTFSMLSRLATLTALSTFVSLLLATIFSATQGKPAGYSAELGDPIVSAFPVKGTTFVQGMAAFLNISYTLLGQLSLPSFIAEMRDARDFPKALWACTIAQIIIYSLVGGIIYAYTGTQYVTAPAFGSLHTQYKKISFSFMVPTLIFLGCLYASVTARFVFFRLFRNSRHLNNHTVVGWSSWAGILLATWILAFIISQVIPFFNSLLSIMSSIFDSWFGFIFWGVAYLRMRSADQKAGIDRATARDRVGIAVNIFIILIGAFVLTVGTYASTQGIIDFFRSGAVGGVFSCKSNGI